MRAFLWANVALLVASAAGAIYLLGFSANPGATVTSAFCFIGMAQFGGTAWREARRAG